MKKKLLAIVLVLSMVFAFAASACGSSEGVVSNDEFNIDLDQFDDEYEYPTEFPGEFYEMSVNTEPGVELDTGEDDEEMDQIGMSGYGGEETYIGFGMNLLDSATLGDKKKQLFLSSVYETTNDNNTGNKYIHSADPKKGGYSGAVSDTHISTSLTEVHHSINVGASVGTGTAIPFFSGKLSTQYGESETVASNSMFYKATVSITTRQQTLLAAYSSAQQMRQLVDPEVLDVIDNGNAESIVSKIFDVYGTHIITGADLGGAADVSAVYNSNTAITKTELSVALDFKSKWVNADSKVEMTDSQKAINSETNIHVQCTGGEEGLLMGKGSIAAISAALSDWCMTVEGEPSIAKITEVIPIWELATNETRARAIESAFNSLVTSRNELLKNYFPRGATKIINGMEFSIRSAASPSRVFDVYNQSVQTKAPVHLWEYLKVPSQTWQFRKCKTPGDEDYWFMVNVNSKKYLDIYKHGCQTEGTQLWQYGDANNAANTMMTEHQKFKIIFNDDDTISILPKVSIVYDSENNIVEEESFAISASGGNGAAVTIEPYFSFRTRQKWYLIDRN